MKPQVRFSFLLIYSLASRDANFFINYSLALSFCWLWICIEYILDPKARIGLLYLAVVGSVALVYSFQTLYVNVDNTILRGGTHAIRAASLAGLTFSTVHLPYHISLVLFATGLGIIIRDVMIDPVATPQVLSHMLETSVRAATTPTASGPASHILCAGCFLCRGPWSLLFVLYGRFAQRKPA